ncbi:hypothetical protein NVP1189B_28 [Vibrio phage 1.189.B._10N.286.51.B5]|nr:hypothetical protein NVP1189B_28 [Vibrio phage 1.189.B._10N.286.51.B5]AUR93920.1 hypothetical protein NVP1189C_28 [Vibrio phage 1.189.C._10N.286.51.B5]AUR93986.1 hypothetical protein NVP1189O_28 [Vibrio phage 1.189.O._10N.286.51.B5]
MNTNWFEVAFEIKRLHCLLDTIGEEIDSIKSDNEELLDLLRNLVNPDNCKKDIIHIIGNAESILEKHKESEK